MALDLAKAMDAVASVPSCDDDDHNLLNALPSLSDDEDNWLFNEVVTLEKEYSKKAPHPSPQNYFQNCNVTINYNAK